jgi:hypothetical protein
MGSKNILLIYINPPPIHPSFTINSALFTQFTKLIHYFQKFCAFIPHNPQLGVQKDFLGEGVRLEGKAV